MRRNLAGLAAALVLTAPAAAQGEVDEAFRLMTSGRYLEALTLVEGAPVTPETAGGMGQISGTLRAFLGDEEGAIAGFRLTLGEGSGETAVSVAGEPLSPVDAIAAIREAAADHRIVMINEAHNISRHRAFTAALLEALAEDGFTVFAAEGFAPDIAERIAAAGYPELGSSAYVQDPFFAGMIRRATALGMTLAPYEERPEQSCYPDCTHAEHVWWRERVQGENLAAFLDANPEARVIVHVGYMHLSEHRSETRPDRLRMAGHVRRLTGLDPLTIDQTSGTPHASPIDQAIIDHLLRTYPIGAPSVYRCADGDWFGHPGVVDMTVYHPDYPPVAGRPGWIAAYTARRAFPIAADALPADRPLVLQAFNPGEGERAIPIDQLILEAPGGATLMLPQGEYRLVAQRFGAPDLELGPIVVGAAP